jgi:tripartite-type tricarboxylate transporter receptor subunit TctC
MVFATAGAVVSHMKDGKLKALGVTTVKPSPLIPGVPTIASQGLRDYDLDTIGFIVGPAKMPQPLVKKLNAHIVQIMHQADVKERLAAGGSESVTGTPQELYAKLASDDKRMRALFKRIGLSADR